MKKPVDPQEPHFLTQRKIAFLGAPFCEGQNLVGTDLAPTAMREAGLEKALSRIGWGWEDLGDIDFKEHFRKLRGQAASGGEHLDGVKLYQQWLVSGMSENFSIWARKSSN